ncbi:hypothetical protein AB0M23_02055 [Streptomyces sp. NPDC052077]|uniref:purine-cytosine permease family protein n=1 Tax=Streptomyces sp. NPDC052077 TaxID=3154757 RepID=UPI00343A1A13
MSTTTAEGDRADDFAHSVVPSEARAPRVNLTMSSWSLISGMAWLFYGALAATLVGTRQALIGLLISVVLFSLANSPMVRLAASTGLNSALVSARLFGRAGSLLIALLLAATTVYFAVLEGSVVAEAFHQYWGMDIRWWYLIVVAGMLPLMMGGILTWMGRLNGILLPLYVVGMVAALVLAARQGEPGHFLDFPGTVPEAARTLPGWLTTVILYLGVWLVMPTTLDFARFARTDDIRYHQVITFGWVFSAGIFLANGIAGMFLVQMVLPGAAVASETGVVSALVGPLGFAGVLLIVVTQIRIQTLNFYQSSMNLQRLLRQLTGVRTPRPVMVAGVSVLVFVLMLTDVFSYLQLALQWQGTFFVGWVGIVLTHLSLRAPWRSDDVPFRPALCVWVVSAAVGIALIQASHETAPLVSLALAVLGYLPIALRHARASKDPETERTRREV